MRERPFLHSIIGLACACLLTIGQSQADTEVRLTATTDYRQRGLQQNDHGIAYQGLLEYEFDSGLFVGAWASSVDFGSFDNRSFELDYFVGFGRRLTPNLAFDVTVIYYTYPGDSGPRNYDSTEYLASVYVGDRWLFSTGLAHNWLSLDERTNFVEGSYRYPLPLSLTLDVTMGLQTLPEPFPDYAYGELGISRRFGPLDVRVGYAAADDDAKDWFRSFVESRWLASIGYRF